MRDVGQHVRHACRTDHANKERHRAMRESFHLVNLVISCGQRHRDDRRPCPFAPHAPRKARGIIEWRLIRKRQEIPVSMMMFLRRSEPICYSAARRRSTYQGTRRADVSYMIMVPWSEWKTVPIVEELRVNCLVGKKCITIGGTVTVRHASILLRALQEAHTLFVRDILT